MHTILCQPCGQQAFTMMIGKCDECNGFTASSSYTLCQACAIKNNSTRCQACGCNISSGSGNSGSAPADQNS